MTLHFIFYCDGSNMEIPERSEEKCLLFVISVGGDYHNNKSRNNLLQISFSYVLEVIARTKVDLQPFASIQSSFTSKSLIVPIQTVMMLLAQ